MHVVSENFFSPCFWRWVLGPVVLPGILAGEFTGASGSTGLLLLPCWYCKFGRNTGCCPSAGDRANFQYLSSSKLAPSIFMCSACLALWLNLFSRTAQQSSIAILYEGICALQLELVALVPLGHGFELQSSFNSNIPAVDDSTSWMWVPWRIIVTRIGWITEKTLRFFSDFVPYFQVVYHSAGMTVFRYFGDDGRH